MRGGAIALTAALLAYLGLSIFGAVAAMTIPRLPVRGSPADVGLAYQDVAFPARVDGVNLSGWFIPGPGADVIIRQAVALFSPGEREQACISTGAQSPVRL